MILVVVGHMMFWFTWYNWSAVCVRMISWWCSLRVWAKRTIRANHKHNETNIVDQHFLELTHCEWGDAGLTVKHANVNIIHDVYIWQFRICLAIMDSAMQGWHYQSSQFVWWIPWAARLPIHVGILNKPKSVILFQIEVHVATSSDVANSTVKYKNLLNVRELRWKPWKWYIWAEKNHCVTKAPRRHR